MLSIIVIIIAGDKPKLKDVFKELLPQATEWKTIGTLLGIEEHILDKIKCDEEGARDRLQKMLSEWLKQADPLPTWKELADAMEAVDALKAKELRSRSADIAWIFHTTVGYSIIAHCIA